MNDTSTSLSSPGTHRRWLPTCLAVDAGWDLVVGLGLCLACIPATAGAVGLPTARPWPAYVALAAACVVFSVLLVRAARCADTLPIARLAAIANAAAAVASLDPALPSGLSRH